MAFKLRNPFTAKTVDKASPKLMETKRSDPDNPDTDGGGVSDGDESKKHIEATAAWHAREKTAVSDPSPSDDAGSLEAPPAGGGEQGDGLAVDGAREGGIIVKDLKTKFREQGAAGASGDDVDSDGPPDDMAARAIPWQKAKSSQPNDRLGYEPDPGVDGDGSPAEAKVVRVSIKTSEEPLRVAAGGRSGDGSGDGSPDVVQYNESDLQRETGGGMETDMAGEKAPFKATRIKFGGGASDGIEAGGGGIGEPGLPVQYIESDLQRDGGGGGGIPEPAASNLNLSKSDISLGRATGDGAAGGGVPGGPSEIGKTKYNEKTNESSRETAPADDGEPVDTNPKAINRLSKVEVDDPNGPSDMEKGTVKFFNEKKEMAPGGGDADQDATGKSTITGVETFSKQKAEPGPKAQAASDDPAAINQTSAGEPSMDTNDVNRLAREVEVQNKRMEGEGPTDAGEPGDTDPTVSKMESATASMASNLNSGVYRAGGEPVAVDSAPAEATVVLGGIKTSEESFRVADGGRSGDGSGDGPAGVVQYNESDLQRESGGGMEADTATRVGRPSQSNISLGRATGEAPAGDGEPGGPSDMEKGTVKFFNEKKEMAPGADDAQHSGPVRLDPTPARAAGEDGGGAPEAAINTSHSGIKNMAATDPTGDAPGGADALRHDTVKTSKLGDSRRETGPSAPVDGEPTKDQVAGESDASAGGGASGADRISTKEPTKVEFPNRTAALPEDAGSSGPGDPSDDAAGDGSAAGGGSGGAATQASVVGSADRVGDSQGRYSVDFDAAQAETGMTKEGPLAAGDAGGGAGEAKVSMHDDRMTEGTLADADPGGGAPEAKVRTVDVQVALSSNASKEGPHADDAKYGTVSGQHRDDDMTRSSDAAAAEDDSPEAATIGHEATHTVQQRAQAATPLAASLSDAGAGTAASDGDAAPEDLRANWTSSNPGIATAKAVGEKDREEQLTADEGGVTREDDSESSDARKRISLAEDKLEAGSDTSQEATGRSIPENSVSDADAVALPDSNNTEGVLSTRAGGASDEPGGIAVSDDGGSRRMSGKIALVRQEDADPGDASIDVSDDSGTEAAAAGEQKKWLTSNFRLRTAAADPDDDDGPSTLLDLSSVDASGAVAPIGDPDFDLLTSSEALDPDSDADGIEVGPDTDAEAVEFEEALITD